MNCEGRRRSLKKKLAGTEDFGEYPAGHNETLLIPKKKEVPRDQRSKVATNAIELGGLKTDACWFAIENVWAVKTSLECSECSKQW